jgi:RNA polymerase sigma-70 factor, ECF subfamily
MPFDYTKVGKILASPNEIEAERAFNEIYNDLYPKLLNFLKQTLDDPADRQDVIHAVFERIWKNRLNGKLIRNVTGYVYKATTNDAVRLAKRGAIHVRRIPTDTEDDHDFLKKDKSSVRNSETYLRLSPRRREVVDLRLDGYSFKEIGEMLSMSTDTARTHFKHATVFFKKNLSKGDIQ